MVAAVVVPLVGLGFYWSFPPKPGVTRETFRRLRLGMTRAEVEAAMGDNSERQEKDFPDAFFWENGEVRVSILFDGQGKVKDGAYRNADIAQERMADGPWNRFCDWLKDWTGW
jgi:hypothetical protein